MALAMSSAVESLRAPAGSWGAELANYEREKRRTVDEGLLRCQQPRMPMGHVQAQERIFDPLLQRYRDMGREAKQRHNEERERVAHLNRAQDIQIMREQPFHIIHHESKLEALAPGEDPGRLGGRGSETRRNKEGKPSYPDTALDYNIVSNLPLSTHHWARPEDRPTMKERSPQPRKVHQHLVKDFHIITNRYLEDHEEKDSKAKRCNLLESTQKYMRQNRFDPLTQQFNDPRNEEIVRTCDHAREMEIHLRAQAQEPPSFKGRQSAHYGIISHKVHDKDMIKLWDSIEEERRDRFKNRYIVEHNLHAQDIKGDHITNARRLNRIAPERFEESQRRGYDIIDNVCFGPQPQGKHYHEPLTRSRPSPWDRICDGRASTGSLPAAPSLSSTASTAHNATLRLPPEPDRRLSASSSAQQLRPSPTPGPSSSGGMLRAASATSSMARSGTSRSDALGGSYGGRTPAPAPPGQTRPMAAAAPPPPLIPGSQVGSVFSQPKG